jgi:hypothetical protein
MDARTQTQKLIRSSIVSRITKDQFERANQTSDSHRADKSSRNRSRKSEVIILQCEEPRDTVSWDTVRQDIVYSLNVERFLDFSIGGCEMMDLNQYAQQHRQGDIDCVTMSVDCRLLIPMPDEISQSRGEQYLWPPL